MVFQVWDNTNSVWVDLVPYIAYQGFEGSRNDVDGPDAGRVIEDAKMYRQRVATKYKFTFTTIPLRNSVAKQIEGWLMPEYIRIKTDYYTSSATEYECYSNNIQKTYVIYKGYDMVKLSVPIVER